jgi:hypothetical protein
VRRGSPLNVAALRGNRGECYGTVTESASVESNVNDSMEIGDGNVLEKVDNFCCPGDTLSKQGGAGAAVTARVPSGWTKFNELAPILTVKDTTMLFKGQLYDSCMTSRVLYRSVCCMVANPDQLRLK